MFHAPENNASYYSEKMNERAIVRKLLMTNGIRCRGCDTYRRSDDFLKLN
jgi:hypothetical protein